MDIFYINLANFNKEILEKFSLEYNDGKSFSNELKKLQHYAGIYLVDYVAKNYFNILNTEICYKNNKPFFKNSDMYFSISHSKNLVVAVFDKDIVGIDVEYSKKNRDFVTILNRFDVEISNFNLLPEQEQRKQFYEFWTKYEAKIKLGINTTNNVFYSTTDIEDDYTLSVATLNASLIEKLIDINA